MIRLPPEVRNSKWAEPAVLILTTVALGWVGYWRMFAHFPGYDDEGYIMLTLRNYLEHGALYGGVYTQYGPGFYVLLEAVTWVTGSEVTHAFARWFTLVLWIGSAGGSGRLIRRETGSAATAWGVGVAVFLFLYQFSEEAFHPGSIAVVLTPAILLGMTAALRAGNMVQLMAWAGAGAALLGLLKINVGVLFLLGVAVWYLLTLKGQSEGRWWRGGAVIGASGLAGVLMVGGIAEEGVIIFLMLTVVGLIGLSAVGRPVRSFAAAPVGAFVVAAGLVVGLVVGAVMMRGTTGVELFSGVILGPLQHADKYSYAIDWRSGTVVGAIVSLLVLGSLRGLRSRQAEAEAKALVIGLRVILLGGTLAVIAGMGNYRVFGAMFSYIMPWLWVWVVPLGSTKAERQHGDVRLLVAAVLLLQMLQAYPVGGIQVGWGSFLWLVLVGLALPETWAAMRGVAGRLSWWGCVLPRWVLVIVAVKLALTGWGNQRVYASQTPLDLPGTGALRLSPREVATYRTLTINSVLHADVLFSLPGMFSFNLWSGVPTPNTRNTTLWFALLEGSDQQEIIAALDRAERPAIIADSIFLLDDAAGRSAPSGPLYDYIRERFVPVFVLRSYVFMVRPDQLVAPYGTAWRGGAADKIQTCSMVGGGVVHSIRLLDTLGQFLDLPLLDGTNTQVTVQPINQDGTMRGPGVVGAWPLQWQGLAWITLRSAVLADPVAAKIRLLDFTAKESAQSVVSVMVGD